jgi:hypothetical protein
LKIYEGIVTSSIASLTAAITDISATTITGGEYSNRSTKHPKAGKSSSLRSKHLKAGKYRSSQTGFQKA